MRDKRMRDERIVYGARCTWWDSIQNAGSKPSGLPCCPHCGSVLFEARNEEVWIESIKRFEREGNPNYLAMMTWARGKCFPNFDILEDVFSHRN